MCIAHQLHVHSLVWAVITDISNTIFIPISLVRVEVIRTVVTRITLTILVSVLLVLILILQVKQYNVAACLMLLHL